MRFASLAAPALLALAALSTGCTDARSAADLRPPAADKWLKRAESELTLARADEANDAIRKALALAPADPEIVQAAARIALSRLEYDEVLRLLRGVETAEARGLRGRAYWYRGELTAAADELEAMLNDPEVNDPWAKSIAKLARQGAGRTPFQLSGGLLANVELAHVSPVAPYFVAPVEIDGEQALALVSTGVAEVVIDAATRPEPSWVGLRFGGRIEVQDVPALSQDLTGLSKEIGAPIKALLGVHLLRHLNPTLDYGGHQLVVRNFAPPPPPAATRIGLVYARGGGMLMPTSLGTEESSRAALFVDSSRPFPIALDDAGWNKAGVAPNDLKDVAADPSQKLKEALIPLLRVGTFDLRRVPGLFGAPIADIESGLKVDIDGIVGSPVLASYRLTLADGGRVLWVEDDSEVRRMIAEMRGPEPTDGAPVAEPGAPPPPAPPSTGPVAP